MNMTAVFSCKERLSLLYMEEQGPKKNNRCQHEELSKNIMLLHTVVCPSDDFIFKLESLDKAGLDLVISKVPFGVYLRRLKIRMENLSSLNILISLKK